MSESGERETETKETPTPATLDSSEVPSSESGAPSSESAAPSSELDVPSSESEAFSSESGASSFDFGMKPPDSSVESDRSWDEVTPPRHKVEVLDPAQQWSASEV